MRSGSMQGFSWVQGRGDEDSRTTRTGTQVRQYGYGKGGWLEMVSWLCKQVSQSGIGPGPGPGPGRALVPPTEKSDASHEGKAMAVSASEARGLVII